MSINDNIPEDYKFMAKEAYNKVKSLSEDYSKHTALDSCAHFEDKHTLLRIEQSNEKNQQEIKGIWIRICGDYKEGKTIPGIEDMLKQHEQEIIKFRKIQAWLLGVITTIFSITLLNIAKFIWDHISINLGK